VRAHSISRFYEAMSHVEVEGIPVDNLPTQSPTVSVIANS
jgi:hypothetical protein